MEAVLCHTIDPFSHTPLLVTVPCKESLAWFKVSGLWALSGIPLIYPVISLCHGDPAVLDLQDQSLHMLQLIIDGIDVGGPTQSPGPGPGWLGVGQPASRPLSSPPW